MRLEQLPDVLLEQLVRHPEAAARVEQLLREEEAVRAVEIADGAGWLREQVERPRRLPRRGRPRELGGPDPAGGHVQPECLTHARGRILPTG